MAGIVKTGYIPGYPQQQQALGPKPGGARSPSLDAPASAPAPESAAAPMFSPFQWQAPQQPEAAAAPIEGGGASPAIQSLLANQMNAGWQQQGPRAGATATGQRTPPTLLQELRVRAY